MTLNGYDIASYQANMIVSNVKSDFAIVKATQGLNYVNPYCNLHVGQALNSGKKLGLYHFANLGTSAIAEADYFLRNISNYIGKAMLVLDYEGSAVNNGVNWAKTWLDHVYAKTGVRPLIYMGLSDENRLNWTPVVKANYGLWLAQYNNFNTVNGYAPRDLYGSLKYWPNAAMFQYTSTGRLAGWSGNLDFDVFYGDKNAWDAYVKGSKVATTINETPAKTTVAKTAKQSATTTSTFVDSLGVTWHKETGKFTTDRSINLRWGATTQSSLIATIGSGQTVNYDAYAFSSNLVWIRQPRGNGQYGYMATGEANGSKRKNYWGTFK
ncbi:GH25 family lysozyme [Paucilactobacillus sp. N302-9]